MLIIYTIFILLTLFLTYKIISILLIAKEQKNIENKAKLLPNSFPNIKIGASFSPENWQERCEDEGITDQEEIQKLGLKSLQNMREDLNLRDIRFGIRWNKVINKNNEFDFSYYETYFDYLIKNNFNICLNIGPIKVFRWPEEHLPYSLIDQLTLSNILPNKRAKINKKNIVAKEGINFLQNQLFPYLINKYSEKELKNIKIIQPENEANNRFGVFKWEMTENHLEEVIKIIHYYFPHAKILLNSPGTPMRISDFLIFTNPIQRLVNLFKKFPNIKFTLGINYYHLIPNKIIIPFFRIILDTISMNKFYYGLNFWDKIIKKSKKQNFSLEITELQMESWGDQTLPGNSFIEFIFTINRCYKDILKSNKKNSIIRVWGIEKFLLDYLLGKFNKNVEKQKIYEYIKTINNPSKDNL